LVGESRFRDDLHYRLNVIEVRLPPLRDRGRDVLLCAQYFIDRYRRESATRVQALTETAAEKLLAHNWPGNMRELENTILRAITLAQTDRISVEDLPEPLRKYRKVRSTDGVDEEPLLPLEEIERRHILRVLEATNGNKTVAAQILGVDRRTLYRKNLDEELGPRPRALATMVTPGAVKSPVRSR
jgi:two-component system response regulator HydG